MKWHSTLVCDEEVRDFMKSFYYDEFNENNDFLVELQALQNDLPKGIRDDYLLWRVCKGGSPGGLTDWGSFATTADEAEPYFIFANQINDFAQKWHLPNIDGSPDVCHSITSVTPDKPNPILTPSTLIFDPIAYGISIKIADLCHSDDGVELEFNYTPTFNSRQKLIDLALKPIRDQLIKLADEVDAKAKADKAKMFPANLNPIGGKLLFLKAVRKRSLEQIATSEDSNKSTVQHLIVRWGKVLGVDLPCAN